MSTVCSIGEEQSIALEAVLTVPPNLVESAILGLRAAGCLPQSWHQGARHGTRIRSLGTCDDREALRCIPVLADASRYFELCANAISKEERSDDLHSQLCALLQVEGVKLLHVPILQTCKRLPAQLSNISVHSMCATESWLLTKPPKGSFTFVELFAGIGGFRVGLEVLGGECLFSSEIGKFAVSVYEKNFGNEPAMMGDICDVSDDALPPHDLLVGGFPCQPFSSLGVQSGLGEEKGLLFKQIVRVLALRRPKAFLLENVPGILTCDGGRAIESVLCALREVGYDVTIERINARCLVAQSRNRVYFVGLRRDVDSQGAAVDVNRFQFPTIFDLQLRAGDVLESDAEVVARGADAELTVSDDLFAQRRLARSWINGGPNKLAWDDKVCDTLVSHYGSGIIEGNSQLVPRPPPHNPRLFSPRECASLMGFPTDFQLGDDALFSNVRKKNYRKLGNAVCPPVIAAVAGAILAHCGDLSLGHAASADWVATGHSAAIFLAMSALPLDKRMAAAKRLGLHESLWSAGGISIPLQT